MKTNTLYSEKLSSNKTEALFLMLMMIFLLLFLWRVTVASLDAWAVVLLCFGGLFFFYVLNFRTLIIQLTPEVLTLTFGIFRWRVTVENIEDCAPDEMPVVMKYGGAGIHFMMIRNRYRASFNFLEYPRVVIAFKRKVGWVRDLCFSTRQPEELLQALRLAMVEQRGPTNSA